MTEFKFCVCVWKGQRESKGANEGELLDATLSGAVCEQKAGWLDPVYLFWSGYQQ